MRNHSPFLLSRPSSGYSCPTSHGWNPRCQLYMLLFFKPTDLGSVFLRPSDGLPGPPGMTPAPGSDPGAPGNPWPSAKSYKSCSLSPPLLRVYAVSAFGVIKCLVSRTSGLLLIHLLVDNLMITAPPKHLTKGGNRLPRSSCLKDAI